MASRQPCGVRRSICTRAAMISKGIATACGSCIDSSAGERNSLPRTSSARTMSKADGSSATGPPRRSRVGSQASGYWRRSVGEPDSSSVKGADPLRPGGARILAVQGLPQSGRCGGIRRCSHSILPVTFCVVGWCGCAGWVAGRRARVGANVWCRGRSVLTREWQAWEWPDLDCLRVML